MDILMVSKGETLSTHEIKRFFENSDDLNKLKSMVEKAKDRLFLSWDTVEVPDKVNETIKIDEYLIRKYEVYVNERNGAISDNHSNKIVGQTLSYKPMKHPEEKEFGILTLNKIFNNYSIDDKVWKGIVSGERGGVSVSGESHKQDTNWEKGIPVKEIKQMDVLEKATTERPCNPLSLNISTSMVAKSEEIEKPFGDWSSFKDCVQQNQDRRNPEAFCAWMEHKITGKWPTEKTIEKAEKEKEEKIFKSLSIEKKLDKLNELLDKL